MRYSAIIMRNITVNVTAMLPVGCVAGGITVVAGGRGFNIRVWRPLTVSSTASSRMAIEPVVCANNCNTTCDVEYHEHVYSPTRQKDRQRQFIYSGIKHIANSNYT